MPEHYAPARGGPFVIRGPRLVRENSQSQTVTQHHRTHACLTIWLLFFLLEARPAPKPQPIGSFPFLFLCTTATACLLFVIWRRSEMLRTVVAHQLKTWTRQEGAVRLSEDDGPPAHSFLEEDDDVEQEEEGGESDSDGIGWENARRVPPVELQRVGIVRAEASSLPMNEASRLYITA
ncbi:hypothetical protein EDB92DRAFT_1032914 [Lactarius akahatsu]|uniref:Uncharacterized protein n=1 Tax=Lactarius akahatsu TaxID=416441 RepID=A0AAD4LEP7_9AGAM|nr:hypothetical protein EDB92DRAFT_1032914 [Lactarius akahatsu]